MNERWATFDCCGTLIDWNLGIRRVLGRVFGDTSGDNWPPVPLDRCVGDRVVQAEDELPAVLCTLVGA